MTLGHKWDMNSVYEGKVQWKSTQPPPDSDFCCPLFHRAREMTSASGHWKHISASCSSIIGDRLPPYHFPISKTISQNQSPHNCSMPPASRRDWWCFWCAAVHSGLRIPQIFVISFWLWNTSSVVRVLLCSTARWWVREACHRAGERPCVPTGLVLSGAWHTIQCLAAQPELQASKHFHWIKESPAQTDRQTDRQRLNVKVGAVAERCTQTMRFLSVCSFPARGSSPPISSFQNDATGQISLSLPSNRW